MHDTEVTAGFWHPDEHVREHSPLVQVLVIQGQTLDSHLIKRLSRSLAALRLVHAQPSALAEEVFPRPSWKGNPVAILSLSLLLTLARSLSLSLSLCLSLFLSPLLTVPRVTLLAWLQILHIGWVVLLMSLPCISLSQLLAPTLFGMCRFETL